MAGHEEDTNQRVFSFFTKRPVYAEQISHRSQLRSSCTSDPRLARSSLQVDRGAISRLGRPTHEPYSAATLLIVSDSRKFKLEEHSSAMKGITKCRLRRFEVGLNAHR